MSEQLKNNSQPDNNSIEPIVVDSTPETENTENENANSETTEAEIAETETSEDLVDLPAVGEQNSRSPVVQERIEHEPQA